jgi:hypothetical protein
VVTIPAPEVEPVFEIVEEAPASTPAAKPYGKPVEDDDSYDGTTYGIASESGDDDDDSGRKGSAPRGKARLPNFRKGKDNYT